MAYEPSFQETYKTILHDSFDESNDKSLLIVEECELPLINLGRLNLEQLERDKCINEIAQAAREWGFFQIVNHGIPQEILSNLRSEQVKVFHMPFEKKVEDKFLNLSASCYSWGNPEATSIKQVIWSESLHVSLADIPRMDNSLRYKSFVDFFLNIPSSSSFFLFFFFGSSLYLWQCINDFFHINIFGDGDLHFFY